MQNFMLIPNLITKFKKSVPLKSYSKKTIKKAVGLELQHIVRDSNCPRTYLYMVILVSCRFVPGQ